MSQGIRLARLVAEAGFSAEAAQIGLRAGFRCEYCERDLLESIESYDAWEHDHLHPTSKGGAHHIDNYALSCRLCNKLKKAWTPGSRDGGSRTEVIDAARDYIAQLRVAKQVHLDLVRAIVRESLEVQR